MIETIEETTVGDLDGVRVPMGNMTQGTYTLPDGQQRAGWICSLALPPAPGEPQRPGVFVGQGSVVELGRSRWEVLSVNKVPGELGSVTLRRLLP